MSFYLSHTIFVGREVFSDIFLLLLKRIANSLSVKTVVKSPNLFQWGLFSNSAFLFFSLARENKKMFHEYSERDVLIATIITYNAILNENKDLQHSENKLKLWKKSKDTQYIVLVFRTPIVLWLNSHRCIQSHLKSAH